MLLVCYKWTVVCLFYLASYKLATMPSHMVIMALTNSS